MRKCMQFPKRPKTYHDLSNHQAKENLANIEINVQVEDSEITELHVDEKIPSGWDIGDADPLYDSFNQALGENQMVPIRR